ncbi:MAG: metal-dependent transcriptional regulator [Coriobacteriia bacterium]|nr:metal-dependent transcriptional regulator [Coriobacteriia bacterium]
MNEHIKRSAGTPRLSNTGEISDATGTPRLSSTNEDYLEAIYTLGGQQGLVRSVDLASHLGVSKASVNNAVNTLKQAGLVEQPHYGNLSLTLAGAEYASSVLHRHLVLFRFLSEILGVDPEVASDEACLMEHAISSETLQRFVSFIDVYSQEA